MARSRLREEQVKDEDFVTEYEHTQINHMFVSLSDTPTTFSGSGGKYLRVGTTESGIEYASGYTGVIEIITSVNFSTETTVTGYLTFSNGILTTYTT